MTTKHPHRGRTEAISRGAVDVPDGGPRPLPHAAYPGAGTPPATGYSPCRRPCRPRTSRAPGPTAASGTKRSSRRT